MKVPTLTWGLLHQTIASWIRAGMILAHQEDASAELVRLLDDLSGKLGALSAWQNISAQDSSFDQGWMREAPALIQQVKQLVLAGRLGYWLFVAEKPA